ncbi:hypothetical protein D9758_001464 [Tetrapyrgos nigripes]|uniref:Uncharacterized protein n=1 Tax=Tetrapyrgos nigripes TaxID=182062 RepID=A0A8H5LXL4_9AGAR|nr:hypothetical protein D9758_001464 [Tetrapyrgos nigripes]
MSVTLTQLVNFLTRPLLLTGSTPPLQLTHLQLSLYNNFPTGFVSPFTLHLSPHSLPITSIYAACLAAGVDWHNWVRSILLLSGGAGEMYIFVMEGTIRVCVDGGKTVTVWTEEPSDDEVPAIAVSRSRVHVNHKPLSLTTGSITCASRTASFPSTAATTTTTTTAAPSKFINTTTTGADAANANNYNAITDMSASPSPMTIKLQAMIDSVRSCTRSRNPKVGLAQGAGNAESRPIRLPTLPVIPSLSIISSSSSSSSRVGVTTSSCSMPSSPYIPSVIVLPIDIDELTVPVAVASAPCSPILSPVYSHTPIYVSSDSIPRKIQIQITNLPPLAVLRVLPHPPVPQPPLTPASHLVPPNHSPQSLLLPLLILLVARFLTLFTSPNPSPRRKSLDTHTHNRAEFL